MIKKIFTLLKSLAVVAFLLGVLGVGGSDSRVGATKVAANNSCVLSDNQSASLEAQQENESPDLFVTCGGFL